jgi:DNA-directed RNA polymerase subunit RPC12/RpoP
VDWDKNPCKSVEQAENHKKSPKGFTLIVGQNPNGKSQINQVAQIAEDDFMAEFKFFCPQCGQHILCDSSYSGRQINCPVCQQNIVVPQVPAAVPVPPPAPASVYALHQSPASAAARPYPVTPVAQTAVPVKSRVWHNLLITTAAVLVLAGIGVGVWFGYAKYQLSHYPPGLITLWSGEGNANDRVGSHNAEYVNRVEYVPGKVGKAFGFNGTDASVDLGNWFDLQAFSISLWVKPSASQATYANIMDDYGTGDEGWNLQYDNQGMEFHWGLVEGGPGFGSRGHVIIFSLAADTWQHLMLTRDGNQVASLYLNGTLIGTIAGSMPINYTANKYLRLGRWAQGGRFFNGQLDEIQIYNRALSAAEVQAIYTASK